MKIDLSILIVTMNRAEQLADAVKSCIACNLPKNTEFVIVDNASTDETPQMLERLKQESVCKIKYLRSETNLGVGGGRNYALEHAEGEIIYVLDDDAVIDTSNKNFFIDALKILEDNPNYATLTTQIYDTAWKANRLTNKSHPISNGLYYCYMPCGGSHFLRRNIFTPPIYFPNKYGYEEIATALQAKDKGYENVFCDNLLVIHNPKINKWVKGNTKLLITDIASQYAIKKTLYPHAVTPILWIAYQLRYFKYLKGTKCKSESRYIIDSLKLLGSDFRPIKISTLLNIYRDFGFSIF
ncbi:MAG: glycosyltransferase [Muribaculum sp.]|nr:glycosyltransferase [Muribaculum sp.]